MTSPTPPGWYADPSGSSSLRYWDGVAWTEHVSAASSPGARRGQAADVVLGAGAVLVVAGSALPWLGRDGRSFSSWSFPVESMLRGEPTDGPSTGLVLLVVGVVAIGLALLPTLATRTPHPIFSVLVGSLAFDVALAAVMASATVEPTLTLGPGALVTLLGSVVISASTGLSRARWRRLRPQGAV